MSKCTRNVAVCGVSIVALALIAPSLSAAEYRTTSRGRPVVRQATYESRAAYQTLDEVVEEIQAPEVHMEGVITEPGDGLVDPCWNDACAGNCGGGCGGGCGLCWSYWGSVEFLLWWRRGQDLPPLATTGPAIGLPINSGVLGAPGTEILYPTSTQGNDARPGARITIGAWFDPCEFSGVGIRLYAVGDSTANYDISSDLVPVLARPFYNVLLDQPDADVVAFPDSTTGAISIRNTSRVGGGDIFYRRLFLEDACHRVDLIAGYQYARIDADLQVGSTRTSIRTGGSIPFGTVVDNYDVFDTRNTYNAGVIGLMTEYDRGCLIWSLLAKVGLGNMNQRTEIAGRTITNVPGQPQAQINQGLLALDSNTGIYERDQFALSPELALNVSYQMTECIDLTLGYSFIYWNHVTQPGSQIDTSINPSQITGNLIGEPRPEFLDQDTDYHLHGLNFGLRCIW